MQIINIAIIGCGRIAQRHAHHIQNTEGLKLIAVCDVVEEKSFTLSKEYNCQHFNSIEELLNSDIKIDVVSICSPNGLHAQHSIQALNKGIHVLCEKPMALSSNDCGKMIQAAEKSNKRLFIIKQNRFNPPVVAIKNLIDENKLGNIYSIQLTCFWNRNEAYYENSWKGTLELDGGTLYTQFSHFIDLLYYMFGDIDDTKAFANNFNHQKSIEFEDTGVFILKFKSGAIGTVNYSVNSYKKNMEGSLTIIAEKGSVKIGGQYLNELEYQNIDGIEINNLPAGNKPNNYGEYQGSMSNHDAVYQNLVDVLNNNASISTSMFEGLKTVEIIEKIYKEIRK